MRFLGTVSGADGDNTDVAAFLSSLLLPPDDRLSERIGAEKIGRRVDTTNDETLPGHVGVALRTNGVFVGNPKAQIGTNRSAQNILAVDGGVPWFFIVVDQ